MVTIMAVTVTAQTDHTPRTPGRQPDWQGIWQAETTGSYEISPHSGALGIRAGFGTVVGGEIPHKPEATIKDAKGFTGQSVPAGVFRSWASAEAYFRFLGASDAALDQAVRLLKSTGAALLMI